MYYKDFSDPDSLSDLETPKYSLSEVFEINHSSDEVKRYTINFHEKLIRALSQRGLYFKARTNIRGISYFCTKQKVFIWLGTYPETMTLRFFTGGRRIDGLQPGDWISKRDKIGSKPLHVNSERDLEDAMRIALKSYAITIDWSCGKTKIN